jgi:hypothetical protein
MRRAMKIYFYYVENKWSNWVTLHTIRIKYSE